MVELRMRKRVDGGNHHEKMGLKRILSVSELTIPDMAGTSPDLACNIIFRTSSKPNPASCTPDFSYPLVSSTSLSSSYPISILPIHKSTIISEYKVKLSLSISPCQDQEWTRSTAYTKYIIHQVQHTPSTACTKYSIHQVQHIPSTASTQDCLSSLHSPDDELATECGMSFQRASLHDRPPSASSSWELKGKVTLSHSHVASWLTEEDSLRTQLAVSRPPPSTPPISLHHSLWVHLQPCSITASNFTSKLTRLQPPSSQDHDLQVHHQTRSITVSKFARSSVPSSNLQTHLITASKCISKFAQSWPPGVSPNSLYHHLQVYLQTRSIMAPKCISKLTQSGFRSVSLFTWSSFSGAPHIALKLPPQPVQIYRV